MISLEKISHCYGRKQILDNISLELNTGGITALVGQNGAGKTTLLNIAMGLIRPKSGQVFIKDLNATKLPTHKRVRMGLGYMSQRSSAITDLSVEDNIYLTPKQADDDLEYREGLLKDFSLNDIRRQKVKTLSGGELKKLEFFLCMTMRPKMVLLDEPFAGLDPKTIILVMNLIQMLREQGVSMVIVDHRIEQLQQIADEYVLLDEANIVFHGSKEEFFSSEVVVDKFLGEGVVV